MKRNQVKSDALGIPKNGKVEYGKMLNIIKTIEPACDKVKEKTLCKEYGINIEKNMSKFSRQDFSSHAMIIKTAVDLVNEGKIKDISAYLSDLNTEAKTGHIAKVHGKGNKKEAILGTDLVGHVTTPHGQAPVDEDIDNMDWGD